MSYDYSYEFGCCLSCENAKPGCLCYKCNCTKCLHYIHPSDWDGTHGKCDLRLGYTDAEKKAWAKKKALEDDKKIKLPDNSRKLNVPQTKFNVPWKEGWVKIDGD